MVSFVTLLSMHTILSMLSLASIAAAPTSDLVDKVPGFDEAPFKIYSGYLTVPGPFNENPYDELKIHYQFHESQGSPTDPLVTWHQGGPGGSSLYGQFGEMGYFQVDDNGTHTNPYAWNRIANMLYLESPAGSDDPIGFSYCKKDGEIVKVCRWNDTSQAEAYGHTLKAFYNAFPEYASNDLYLTGESYAGQYVPNIANYILDNMASDINLKGFAVGNACWGGDNTTVNCNGPNSEQNDVDMFYGKGLFSKKLYDQIYQTCKFPNTRTFACNRLLEKMSSEVGPHNVYDIYDNCPQTEEWLKRSGKSMRWLTNYLRDQMSTSVKLNAEASSYLHQLGGGYDWSCGGLDSMETYFQRTDVQQALHLEAPLQSRFDYSTSGPASITLYPKLVKKLRILIYNGDADACVPYKGNEEWTTGLADQGVLTETSAWHPWYIDGSKSTPAGYATSYSVNAEEDHGFNFITIRLAGHMVPAFQPAAAFSFFKTYLTGGSF